LTEKFTKKLKNVHFDMGWCWTHSCKASLKLVYPKFFC